MTVVRVQLPFHEFFVVFFDVSHVSLFQQIVAAIHLDTEGVERGDDLVVIGNDGFLGIR